MSGCSSGYIPFSLAASPFLKVVGKTMFVKWEIKGNMATLYFHSHTANHDKAFLLLESKAIGNFKHEILPCLTLNKSIAGFSNMNNLLKSLALFCLDPSLKATYESDISAYSGQCISTWSKFRKLFLCSKFPKSFFQLKREKSFFLINLSFFKRDLSLLLNANISHFLHWYPCVQTEGEKKKTHQDCNLYLYI